MDPILNNYILFWICIFGLCLGSFYNVVILRSLSEESIVFPPSKCPICQTRLKPWHNIPVLSYIFLRGKCAYCKEKISIQYPIIELVTMGLFAVSFLKFGLEWKTLFAIVLSSALLIMTMTDLKEKLVDCNIAIGLAIFAFLFNGIAYGLWVDSIIGLLVGALIMEAVARLGYLFTKDRAFGEADTYVAGALGACFGLSGLLQILIYTLFAAAIFTVPMFLYKQYKNNQKAICITFILFILTALIYKLLLQSWYTFAALFITGIGLSYLILKSLKQDAEPMYLPLVPAFSVAALYFLFF